MVPSIYANQLYFYIYVKDIYRKEATLSLPLFLPQSCACSSSHGEGCQATAQSKEREGAAGQQETLLPKIPYHRWPPRQEVLEESFLLSQRAEG